MKRTHLNAMELFKQGNINAAWEMAQQDEGLLPEVTQESWVKYATGLVRADAIRLGSQELHTAADMGFAATRALRYTQNW
jgi:hypothetical protein